MNRNLQEDQWENKLREWEESPDSEAWDRPSADLWEHISGDLPSKKSKKIIFWWVSSISMLAAISIGVAMYLIFQTNESIIQAQEEVVVEAANSISAESEQILDSTAQTPNANNVTPTSSYSIPNFQNLNKQIHRTNTQPLYKETVDTSEQHPNSQVSTNLVIAPITNKHKNANLINHPSDSLGMDTTKEERDMVSIIQDQSPNLNIVRAINPSVEEESVHTKAFVTLPISSIKFNVQGEERALPTVAILAKTSNHPWSVDIYTQKKFSNPQYIRTPFIQAQQQKSHLYGVQLNRQIGNRFSIHFGLQETTNVTKVTNRFMRLFDRNNELIDGLHRISEFNLTTELNSGDPLDDNVKIERDDSEVIEEHTRLVFQVERLFSVKRISVPLQLSYSIWTQYPFQLSGLLGAKFLQTKHTIEKGSITIINPEFRIRQFNTGRPAIIHEKTLYNVVAQAGLRLDVHLSPKLSAVTQLELQSKPSQAPLQSIAGRSSVRLGLSYNF